MLIPPTFGLAGVNLSTWTGFGSVTYWNAYVAGTQMHDAATFDARLDNKGQYPVSRKSGAGNTRNLPDKTTAKLAALHFYQLSIPRRRQRPDHPTRPHSNWARRSSTVRGSARPPANEGSYDFVYQTRSRRRPVGRCCRHSSANRLGNPRDASGSPSTRRVLHDDIGGSLVAARASRVAKSTKAQGVAAAAALSVLCRPSAGMVPASSDLMIAALTIDVQSGPPNCRKAGTRLLTAAQISALLSNW
jgi:hypothetical protein